MMSFEAFIGEVKKEVYAAMGTGYNVTIQRVPKNNGITLTGLLVAKDGSGIAPAIYLDSLYEAYINGYGDRSLESIIESIVASYWEHEQEAQQLYDGLETLTDYQKVKNKIIYKLINTRANRELIKQVPNIPFQDLSIVFMLYVKEAEDGICTALINNKHMILWDVTENDLYTEAEKNTPRLLPETCMGMDEVIQKLVIEDGYGQDCSISSELFENEKPPFYVLTNRLGIGGAACLLYPDVLKKCAEKIGYDLLILPSSVHESLLMAYDDTIKADDLRHLVQFVNASEVPAEDRLSEQVYRYYRSNDRIVVAA